MVKLKGPGFGMAASGSLGKAITYSTSKGRAYVKKKPNPKQPRSGLQVSGRVMMTYLSKQWSQLQTAQQDSWINSFPDPRLNAYNSFLRYNLERWRRRAGPTKAYPATDDSPQATVENLTAHNGVRSAKLELWTAAPTFNNWSFLILHSPDGNPALTVENLVHMERVEDADHYFWTHSPLTAGEHFYRAITHTDEGSIHWGSTDDDSAIVT